ncbi:unnamed protein product [Ambrosiozyma monospora]|uniref:Unnamed protein product n=1 Tax=Ambrosiozyma monospora TaxID=43982 RepID=A0A9W6Z0M4_AMBMO|nr:unnamed protein product [Ambrosiozyma monospora]
MLDKLFLLLEIRPLSCGTPLVSVLKPSNLTLTGFPLSDVLLLITLWSCPPLWDLENKELVADFVGHSGYISAITISPDGSLCASGGKDGSIVLWDLASKEVLYSLTAGDEINALAFSPNRYWLCAATSSSIKIYNLQERELKDELKPEVAEGKTPECLSLAWSADGQNLFSGYTDNLIRVWQVMTSS